jgi:hypothetical protein
VAKEFLVHVVEKGCAQGWASDEHFTVDGTLLEAWAGVKKLSAERQKATPAGRSRQSHGELSRRDAVE